MDPTLPFFSLPFVDSDTSDLLFVKKEHGCTYDSLQGSLPSQNPLLGADDVLAHFLTADGPLEEPDLNGPTTLHCEICRKQFDNAKKYYGHLHVHSKSNLWICDKCPDAKFSTKQQLMKHSLTHKPLERVWRCPQCSMAFEALWRLQQHLFAKHLGYRPHKCDVCPKAFYKLSDLKKHKDVHTDVKKHACTVCGVLLKDKSNLKQHMLRHSNVRPFACLGCGARFKQVASMRRHSNKCPLYLCMHKNSNDVDKSIRKNYCRVCGMTFQYKSELLEHCVRQHSNTSGEEDKDKVISVTCNTDKSVMCMNKPNDVDKSIRKNNCRVCGITFQYKSALLEHCVRQHSNMTTEGEKDKASASIDANRTDDNIVDDILSAEDDYLTIPTQNGMLNIYNSQTEADNTDNLMQIEFMKEMKQLHILDDELFYNDIDLNSFQTNQIFNTSGYDEHPTTSDKSTEILFDFEPYTRSMDQDLMNAIYHGRADYLPDELLNVPEIPVAEKPSELDNPTMSVNDCATIFESDVDLEASTNLAANLNQLIGENNVQYVSTEDDDTFIISLNSEIDAEQLTDMLNIGVELVDGTINCDDNVEETNKLETEVANAEPLVVKIEQLSNTQIAPVVEDTSTDEKENKTVVQSKAKKQVLFVCRTCDKVFNKRDNYKSHMATHDESLRRHKCSVCGERFSYRSTLNKHRASAHEPRVLPGLRCDRCPNHYRALWMLKNHIERDHEKKAEFVCDKKDCGKKFYKKSDLDLHKRYHEGSRPYECQYCRRAFTHVSHLRRHARTVCKNRDSTVKQSNQATAVPSIADPAADTTVRETPPNVGFWLKGQAFLCV